jgi:hypothetical protein
MFSQIVLPKTEAEIDLERLERRRRIVVGTTAVILLGAATVGGVALRGHVLYGDWKCGFRTCVVQPRQRKRR